MCPNIDVRIRHGPNKTRVHRPCHSKAMHLHVNPHQGILRILQEECAGQARNWHDISEWVVDLMERDIHWVFSKPQEAHASQGLKVCNC